MSLLLAALLIALGALYAVLAVTAWLDSPRQQEPDRSRGTLAPDHYARKG